jgi:hypothetical protein
MPAICETTSSLYPWYLYANSRPHTPDRLAGRIYALNTHGNIVYLTHGEWLGLYSMMYVGFGLGFIAAMISKYCVKE